MSVFESHRWLGYALRLGVSASLIAWMLGRAELSRVGDVLRAADAMLIAVAFASYFLGYMVSVARWRVLLAVQGIRPRFSYLYWSFMIGVFFNQLLPTTIGGDVARYQYTAAGGRAAALSAVLLDRVFGIVSLMVFAIVGLALAQSNETLSQDVLRPVAGLLVVGVLLLGFAFLLPESMLGLLHRVVLVLPHRARGLIEKVLGGFAAFRGRYDVALAALALVARSAVRRRCTLLRGGTGARVRRASRMLTRSSFPWRRWSWRCRSQSTVLVSAKASSAICSGCTAWMRARALSSLGLSTPCCSAKGCWAVLCSQS